MIIIGFLRNLWILKGFPTTWKTCKDPVMPCKHLQCRDSLSICTFGCNRPRGRPLEGAAAAASGPSEQVGTVGIFAQLLLMNTLTI